MAQRMRPGGLMQIWTTFKQWLNHRVDTKILTGDDYLGNKYFERAVTSEAVGRSRIIRSFEPPTKSGKEDVWGSNWENLPPEWESWLRHKRDDPPTREEIYNNIQLMQQKQENGRKLEAQRQAEIAAIEGGQRVDPVDPDAKVPFPQRDIAHLRPDNANMGYDPPRRDHTIR